MFQSFKTKSDPSHAQPRIARLRTLMADEKLDALLIPRADEHQGEYVASSSERLAWITGFTGSAGMALILADRAILFVDGRYTVQAAEQTDPKLFEVEDLISNPPREWLRNNIQANSRVGFDPWLHTIREIHQLNDSLIHAKAEAIALKRNLVDEAWYDRPEAPSELIKIHPLKYAGVAAETKISNLSTSLKKDNIAHTILTDPASIAWSFNIRGSDVPHTPLVLSFAILSAEQKPQIFLDSNKLTPETKDYLSTLAEIYQPNELEKQITALASTGAGFGIDENLAAEYLKLLIESNGGTVSAFSDPASLPRAMKNQTELNGMRAAHQRDGVAIVKFLAWIEKQDPSTLSEIAVVERLETIRLQVGVETQMPLRDISFDTICGSGPNAALPHYRVTEESNRTIGSGELLLIDSGAQYEDGTTDITRTIAIGTPNDEACLRFTLVLKGMIAISMLRFPAGTRGMDIDAFARAALWRAGLDYNHGTGHGVGSYLSVHEGPQRIAKSGTAKLETGMIVSNEPGYYKPGHYGIRIENLIIVSEPKAVPNSDMEMHSFETLTLAPIDKTLIVASLLSEDERAWLNSYHKHVYSEISPLVDHETALWLEQATSAL